MPCASTCQGNANWWKKLTHAQDGMSSRSIDDDPSGAGECYADQRHRQKNGQCAPGPPPTAMLRLLHAWASRPNDKSER